MRLFHLPTRKLWAVIVTVILGTTLTTISLTQSTASAAQLSDCTRYQNVVCLFEHANYKGLLARYDARAIASTTTACSVKQILHVNDEVSSIWINGPTNIYVKAYADSDCKGTSRTFTNKNAPGGLGRIGDPTLVDNNFNDKMTALWVQFG